MAGDFVLVIRVWYTTKSNKNPDPSRISRQVRNNLRRLTAKTEADRIVYRINKSLLDNHLIVTSKEEAGREFWLRLTNQDSM